MRHVNQSSQRNVPELEKVELTHQEEQIFTQMIEEMLPGSAEETQRFLEGHRQEAQGQ